MNTLGMRRKGFGSSTRKLPLRNSSGTSYLSSLDSFATTISPDGRISKPLKLALESLPDNAILSHVDFAENYGYQVANEIQTEYYHSFQITIMVHITFCINPDFSEDSIEPRIIKELHY
jgi:hypothetical protein